MTAGILLPEKVEMKKTREGFGRALVDLGERALVELGTTYDAWKARLLAG